MSKKTKKVKSTPQKNKVENVKPNETIKQNEAVKQQVAEQPAIQPKKPNKVYKASCITLICTLMMFLSVFGGISLFDKNATISEREQRELTKFPEFTWESFFDGSFFQQFDNAYSDTFPLRDFWLDTYNNLKSLITITVGDTQVIDVGNEETQEELDEAAKKKLEELLSLPFDSTGYEQFTNNSSTSSGIAIEGTQAYYIFNGTIASAENYVNYMKNLQKILPNNRIVTLICPDASAFYASDTYSSGVHCIKDWLEMVDKNLTGIINITPYDILEEHTDEYIYFRTDHHWTVRGAYYAYQKICDKLGLFCYDIDNLQEGKITEFLGSFYNKTNSKTLEKNSDDVYYYLPIFETNLQAYTSRKAFTELKDIKLINENPSSSNKYTCFIGGDNPITYITTTCPSGKSIVIVKDSYANSLVTWLCNNYTNIYVIDPRHINTTETNVFKIEDFVADKPNVDIMFVCVDYNATSINGKYMQGLLKMLK